MNPFKAQPVADIAMAAPDPAIRAAGQAIDAGIEEQGRDGYEPGTGPVSLMGAWTDLGKACASRFGDGPW